MKPIEPCPFCGNPATTGRLMIKDEESFYSFFPSIKCTHCTATIHNHVSISSIRDDKFIKQAMKDAKKVYPKLIEIWNTRVGT